VPDILPNSYPSISAGLFSGRKRLIDMASPRGVDLIPRLKHSSQVSIYNDKKMG